MAVSGWRLPLTCRMEMVINSCRIKIACFRISGGKWSTDSAFKSSAMNCPDSNQSLKALALKTRSCVGSSLDLGEQGLNSQTKEQRKEAVPPSCNLLKMPSTQQVDSSVSR